MKAQAILCVVLVGLCAHLVAAQTCPPALFGSASAYNTFLLGGGSGNFTFDLTNGDVEGRAAVNGNFRGVNIGIGTRLGNCAADSATVVIGGYA